MAAFILIAVSEPTVINVIIGVSAAVFIIIVATVITNVIVIIFIIFITASAAIISNIIFVVIIVAKVINNISSCTVTIDVRPSSSENQWKECRSTDLIHRRVNPISLFIKCIYKVVGGEEQEAREHQIIGELEQALYFCLSLHLHTSHKLFFSTDVSPLC